MQKQQRMAQQAGMAMQPQPGMMMQPKPGMCGLRGSGSGVMIQPQPQQGMTMQPVSKSTRPAWRANGEVHPRTRPRPAELCRQGRCLVGATGPRVGLPPPPVPPQASGMQTPWPKQALLAPGEQTPVQPQASAASSLRGASAADARPVVPDHPLGRPVLLAALQSIAYMYDQGGHNAALAARSSRILRLFRDVERLASDLLRYAADLVAEADAAPASADPSDVVLRAALEGQLLAASGVRLEAPLLPSQPDLDLAKGSVVGRSGFDDPLVRASARYSSSGDDFEDLTTTGPAPVGVELPLSDIRPAAPLPEQADPGAVAPPPPRPSSAWPRRRRGRKFRHRSLPPRPAASQAAPSASVDPPCKRLRPSSR